MDSDGQGSRMTRAEAIGILARMATRRDITLEEVVALQVAMRSTAKRLFDNERYYKRRHAADAAVDRLNEQGVSEIVREDLK